MQHLSRIFGTTNKPITLTLKKHLKTGKPEKLFINYNTTVKLTKEEIQFQDKKILSLKTDQCFNIEINKNVLSFIAFFNEENQITKTPLQNFLHYILEFKDLEKKEIVEIFKPKFEGKVGLSVFDYKNKEFLFQKKLDVKIFLFRDLRETNDIKTLKLPDFIESSFLLTNSLDEFNGNLQFFLDKQNLFFIYILKDNTTKRLEFEKSLDFISFSTCYMNSLEKGFFLPLEEDFESFSNSEEVEDDGKNEELNSFIANLKLSENPNKVMSNYKENILISDGEHLGIFKQDFEREKNLKEVHISKLGKEISKMKYKNEDLFFIDKNTLKAFDMEKQTILKTEATNVKDIFSEEDILRGIKSREIFEIDKREKNMIIPLKQYKTPVNFECANLRGEISAIGSENGDIRIFKGFGKRALVHLNGYGEKCQGLSVWNNFIAATYRNYIILIYGKSKDENKKRPKEGYPLIRKSLIGIKKLSLSLEHTLKFKMANKKFTPAIFYEGKKIISSIENFLISWNLNLNEDDDQNSMIESKEHIKYNLGRFKDQIVTDNVLNDKVFVLFKDKIHVNDMDLLDRNFE